MEGTKKNTLKLCRTNQQKIVEEKMPKISLSVQQSTVTKNGEKKTTELSLRTTDNFFFL